MFDRMNPIAARDLRDARYGVPQAVKDLESLPPIEVGESSSGRTCAVVPAARVVLGDYFGSVCYLPFHALLISFLPVPVVVVTNHPNPPSLMCEQAEVKQALRGHTAPLYDGICAPDVPAKLQSCRYTVSYLEDEAKGLERTNAWLRNEMLNLERRQV